MKEADLLETSEDIRRLAAERYTSGYKRGAEDMRERAARVAEELNVTWLARQLRGLPVLEDET